MSLQHDDPPRSLRQVNCDARRERILVASRDLLATGGVAALTMRRIAKRADLSVTTLYNLIGGREAIISALIDDAIDRMDSILEREAPLEDPLQRCRAVITVSVARIVEDEAVFRPLATSIGDEPSRGNWDKQRISARASGMQSLALRAAIDQGLLLDLLDPDVLGAQIYHGWEGAFYQWGRGLLDEAQFCARALYGLYVSLLGVASERIRPQIERELRALEIELRHNQPSQTQRDLQRA